MSEHYLCRTLRREKRLAFSDSFSNVSEENEDALVKSVETLDQKVELEKVKGASSSASLGDVFRWCGRYCPGDRFALVDFSCGFLRTG
jgi:hypothetical protein